MYLKEISFILVLSFLKNYLFLNILTLIFRDDSVLLHLSYLHICIFRTISKVHLAGCWTTRHICLSAIKFWLKKKKKSWVPPVKLYIVPLESYNVCLYYALYIDFFSPLLYSEIFYLIFLWFYLFEAYLNGGLKSLVLLVALTSIYFI